MQRTLKRELKVLEIVKREAIGVSTCPVPIPAEACGLRVPAEQSFGCRLVCDGCARPPHFGAGRASISEGLGIRVAGR